jgi:DNA-binding MarR family transcriptional regulator
MQPVSTLGTRLRLLTALLDEAVEGAYREAGLDYKPRYTPIVRALLSEDGQSISGLAVQARVSQPSATQTVQEMVGKGLVSLQRGKDARERRVYLTQAAHALVPQLERLWAATHRAADELDSELSAPLSAVVDEALEALQRRSFAERLASRRKS